MGVAIVFFVTILWSLVGVFVKISSSMLDSGTITFLRFAIGVLILGAFLWIKEGRLRIYWKQPWIWYGAWGKSSNYFFENMGIALGFSYGYIIASPISTVVLLLVMAFILREKIRWIDWLSAVLCLMGVFLVNWNGMSWKEMFEGHGFTTLLFVLSGIGVTFHVLSQKKLIQTMDSLSMNLSVFFWCAILTALPVPARFEYYGTVYPGAVASLIILGAITGISFYLFSNALRKVPFFLAVIISNSSVMFSVLWGWWFFDEPVSVYMIAGMTLFLIGMIAVNWPKKPAALKDAAS
jgi:drug/metabolite transporter (DMT)-like permease